MVFENIKNIGLDNEGSWRDKVFLTFDIEWADDNVLANILEIVEEADIKATFFCTHETKILARMRQNPKIELGIHPNFNFLLKGDFRYGKDIREVVEYYMKIIPDAVSVRSHCLSQSTLITDTFIKRGLKYECNTFIPATVGIPLKPWRYYDNNLTTVPLFWEDDIHCLYGWDFNVDSFLKGNGLKVFNFHPVIVFLNSENIQRYRLLKEFYHDFNKLSANRNNGYGIRNFLMDLIGKNI